MQGAFVTVVPGKFGFIAPDRGDLGNLYVTAGTLAALTRAPHRRAVDVVLIEDEQ
ncbi:hypothetical protein [Acidiphilium sp.]|uniref:hypothetical protein n=1 Tax=Acidiphilium sp. TaxID=527 RepID=UPI00258726F6|nr:hypothetical protein [Acidiphilium sp.]